MVNSILTGLVIPFFMIDSKFARKGKSRRYRIAGSWGSLESGVIDYA